MTEPWHRCHLSLVCEKQWTELTPTADPRVRHCSGCERTVHEVATPEEFAAARAHWQCVRLTGRLALDQASPLAVRSTRESAVFRAEVEARLQREAREREATAAPGRGASDWIGLPG
jgi:hypothetical protein